MKVEFLKDEKDSVKIRFENQDATFGKLLEDELWLTKGTDIASISKTHPLVGKPELILEGKDAKKLLKTAAESLKKKAEEFEKAISKL